MRNRTIQNLAAAWLVAFALLTVATASVVDHHGHEGTSADCCQVCQFSRTLVAGPVPSQPVNPVISFAARNVPLLIGNPSRIALRDDPSRAPPLG